MSYSTDGRAHEMVPGVGDSSMPIATLVSRDSAYRAEPALVLLLLIVVVMPVGLADSASAQGCPAAPSGFEQSTNDNFAEFYSGAYSSVRCIYQSTESNPAAEGTSALQWSIGLLGDAREGCGAELADYWSTIGGSAGETLYQTDSGAYERIFVLADNGVVRVEGIEYEGPGRVAQQFVASAHDYAASFYPACSGAGDESSAGESLGDDQGDTSTQGNDTTSPPLPRNDGSGVPVGAVVLGTGVVLLGAGTLVATATRSRRPRAGSNASAEAAECAQVLHDRTGLDAAVQEIQDLYDFLDTHKARLTTDQGKLREFESKLAALGEVSTSAVSGGNVSDMATVLGIDPTGEQAFLKALGTPPKPGPLRGAAAGLSVIGLAANGYGHWSEVQRRNLVERLGQYQTQTEVLRSALAGHQERIDRLEQQIAAASAGLAPKIETWNARHEKWSCAGGPIDVGLIQGPTFTEIGEGLGLRIASAHGPASTKMPGPPKSNAPRLREDDLDDYRCEGLANEIAEHNRKVDEASHEQKERLEKAADLDAKAASLDQVRHELNRQWISLQTEINRKTIEWQTGQGVGHGLNLAGLIAVWAAAPLGTAIGAVNLLNSFVHSGAGPTDASLALQGRFSSLIGRIDLHAGRIAGEREAIRAQIQHVRDPFRVESWNLLTKKRRCRLARTGRSDVYPPIKQLTDKNPGKTRWDRMTILLRSGSWTTQVYQTSWNLRGDELVQVLREIETW